MGSPMLLKEALRNLSDEILNAEIPTGGIVIKFESDGSLRYEFPSAKTTVPEFNQRILNVPPSKTTATLDLVNQIKKSNNPWKRAIASDDFLSEAGFIDMTIGQPNWTLPYAVWSKFRSALHPSNWLSDISDRSSYSYNGSYNPLLLEFTRYAPRRGLPKLLEHLGSLLQLNIYGMEHSKHLMVGSGVKSLLFYCLNSIIRQFTNDSDKDIVIYSSPTWGLYHTQTIIAGGIPIDVPLREVQSPQRSLCLDINKIREIALQYGPHRIRAIIVCTPNNPTSTEISSTEMEELGDMIVSEGLVNAYLLVDEIYRDLVFESADKHFQRVNPCHLFQYHGLSNRVICFNGFSKLHSLCGLRLGYCYTQNAEVLDKMLLYSDNISSCAPTLTQHIMLSALQDVRVVQDWIKQVRQDQENRVRTFVKTFNDMLAEYINQGVVSFYEPTGGFYIYVRVKKQFGFSKMTSDELCQAILHEQQIAVVPGDAFRPCGIHDNHLEFRISLGTITCEAEATNGALRISDVLLAYMDVTN